MQPGARGPELDLDLAGQLVRSQVRAALLGEPRQPVRIGRFEILRCLGQGGYGAVYEAREEGAQSSLALKCLHVAGAAQRSALQREFRAAQRLVHPNLVTLYELFTIEKRPFFTMELVRGRSLLAQLAHQEADEDAICESFEALLGALATIHATGKVHRDLKPSNVLLGEDGRLVVLDYGLMIDGELGALGVRAGGSGTRSYMAPEQRPGASVGPKADLYAVGKMLMEALRVARPSPALAPSGTLQPLAVAMQDPDPARRPSAEQALSRLRAGASRTHGVRLATCFAGEPFVGRAAELRALHDALSRARAGVAALVWVLGDSGMGKSALLREFSAQAAACGALVLEGRCYERENSPFKVFDSVIVGLARHLCGGGASEAVHAHLTRADKVALVQLFPELARALFPATELVPETCDDERQDPSASTQRAFAALHAILARLGARRPVLIAVDDLQWGDADSARLMLALLASALPPGLLFVGAYRGSESQSSPFLRRVLEPTRARLGESALSEIAMTGLSEAEVRALASALGNAAAARDAALLELLRGTHGMPFLLGELLSTTRLADSCETSLEQRMLARTKGCSAQARRLLYTLCIAGRPLSPAVATHAAELDAGIWPSAHELCAQRLARWRESDEGRELEPYHDIVRAWVAERTTGQERVASHRRLARAIECHAPRDQELALTHWLHAGEALEARRCALRAVVQARGAMAWSRAAELYRVALELSGPGDHDQAQLHEAHGEVLAFAAEHAASGAAYARAARLAASDRAQALYRAAAVQLLLDKRSDLGLSAIRGVLDAVGIALPRTASAAYGMWLHARVQLGWRRARARLSGRTPPPSAADTERCEALRAAYRGLTVHDPKCGMALHARYLVEARGRGDEHEFEALAWEAAQQAIVSGAAARRSVARIRREATAIVRGSEQPYVRAMVMLLEASYLVHCRERPRDAMIWLDRAEELIKRCPGSHCEYGWMRMLRDYATMASSAVDLHGYLLAREREFMGRDDAYSHRQLLLTVPLLRLMEGQPASARAFLDRRWPEATHVSDIFEFLALTSRQDVLHYQGDAVTAYALLQASTGGLVFKFASPAIAAHLAYLRARSAVALYAQTRQPELAREVRRATRLRTSLPHLWRGASLGLLASLAIADRDQARAVQLLREAHGELVSCQHDNLAWLVRYRLAQLCGNAPELARADAWIRARGVREPEAWVSVLLPVRPAQAGN